MFGMNKKDDYKYLHGKIQSIVNAYDMYDLGYYKARAESDAINLAYRRPLKGFVDLPKASEEANRVLKLIDTIAKVKHKQLSKAEQDRLDARFNAIKF